MDTTTTSTTNTLGFSCEAEALSEGMALAFRASPGKAPMAALSGVLLRAEESGRLVLSATDGELTIRTSVPANVRSAGEAVLHRLFGEIVRSLGTGSVDVGVDDSGMAAISAGSSKFTLRTYPREDFPALPQAEGEMQPVSAEDLPRHIEQAVVAASSDRTRVVLTGVLLKGTETGTRLVSTDSYRLVVSDLDLRGLLDVDDERIVPARALAEVSRQLHGTAEGLSVVVGDRRIAFRIGSTEIVSNLIEGDFPSYGQLIPDELSNRLDIEKDALLDALRRVGLLARDSTPVRLSLGEGSVRMHAVDPEVGGEAEEEIDGIYSGEEMTVAFNPGFLRDGIEACDGDKVRIELQAPLKPAIISEPASKSFMYLIMPVRVS